jgi:predicted transcriptional regulator
MTVEISYVKNKTSYKKQTWIVSKQATLADIMEKDKRTMKMLEDLVYKKGSRTVKKVVIDKILTKLSLGKENKSAMYEAR